jgi:hypothetical protein
MDGIEVNLLVERNTVSPHVLTHFGIMMKKKNALQFHSLKINPLF